MMASDLLIDDLVASDWPRACAIYLEGILSGNATFETEPPSWDQWNRNHLPVGRLAGRNEHGLVGWAALSPCHSGNVTPAWQR